MTKYLEQRLKVGSKTENLQNSKIFLLFTHLRYNGFTSLSIFRSVEMKKYLAIFKVNWQKSFEYRADFIGHLGMGIITFIVMYFIWTAVFKSVTIFNGYTFSSMMTYVMMTKFLHFVQRGNIGRDIANEIKDGRVSVYLLKPVSYIKWWFSIFLADRSFEFIIRLGMIMTVFAILPNIVIFFGIGRFLFFLSFLTISLVINFLINFLIASLTFWVVDSRLIRSAIIMIIDFLAGTLVPLDVMPKFLKNLGLVLPFQFVTYFPIKIYQGSLAINQIIQGLFLAIVWTVGLFLLLNLVWRKGLRNYEAIGQ